MWLFQNTNQSIYAMVSYNLPYFVYILQLNNLVNKQSFLSLKFHRSNIYP